MPGRPSPKEESPKIGGDAHFIRIFYYRQNFKIISFYNTIECDEIVVGNHFSSYFHEQKTWIWAYIIIIQW